MCCELFNLTDDVSKIFSLQYKLPNMLLKQNKLLVNSWPFSLIPTSQWSYRFYFPWCMKWRLLLSERSFAFSLYGVWCEKALCRFSNTLPLCGIIGSWPVLSPIPCPVSWWVFRGSLDFMFPTDLSWLWTMVCNQDLGELTSLTSSFWVKMMH